MQIILNAPGIHQRTKEGVEKELEEYVPRLKQVLFRFRPEEKRLRVHLVQQKDNAYRLTLSLRMPGKNLIVERTGHTLVSILTEAKQALLEQIKVQSTVVRKEHLRAKSAQQSQAIQEAVGGASGWARETPDEEEMRERFVSRLGLVLQELYSHVRRLIRSSQLAGDIPVNHLRPGEVVDDILVRGYELFRSQSEGEFSPATLYRLADEIIRDEISNYQDREQTGISLEEEIFPQDPRWQVSDLGEEILPFYQEEEALLYGDVMPDAQLPDPARALDEKEQMHGIFRSLSCTSSLARSAFLLERIEGFEPYEIAWMQARPEQEVLGDIRRCEEILKETISSKD
jgi:DNA-directed RNA polymerase specialized sigma24 family protein